MHAEVTYVGRGWNERIANEIFLSVMMPIAYLQQQERLGWDPLQQSAKF